MKKFFNKTIYRLVLSNESRLENIFKTRFSIFTAIIVISVFLIICFIFSFFLIYFTPVRNLIPSKIAEETKSETIEKMLRVDSLQMQLDLNQNYINNILTILDTDRIPSDSTSISTNANPMTVDSIVGRSKLEEEFIKKIEEREKYNISILAPLAAEGMIFNPLSDVATITEATISSPKASFLVTPDHPVLAIADGYVIDTHYSAKDGGYSVIIQHNKGFLSRYSHLGTLLISKGDFLEAGQAIALPHKNTGHKNYLINIEMWRNGTPLIPYSVISGIGGNAANSNSNSNLNATSN